MSERRYRHGEAQAPQAPSLLTGTIQPVSDRDDRLHDAICAAAETGEIITGWMTVTTILDPEGVARIVVNEMPGINTTNALGLAVYADTYYRTIIHTRLTSDD